MLRLICIGLFGAFCCTASAQNPPGAGGTCAYSLTNLDPSETVVSLVG